MSFFVSVIVTIYQSELTLRRCLDSILSQTFEDFELILVDDGSTDSSYGICREYAKDDPRIRIINKSHSGVSDARQLGLDSARGEYVLYCDSDDWMESIMIEKLVQMTIKSKSDLVVCDYIVEKDNESIIHHEFQNSLKNDSLIKNISYFLWNKLLRRSFLVENDILFPKNIMMAEDMYITLLSLSKNACVSYIPLALYHYNQLNNRISITNNIQKSYIESNIKVINSLEYILDHRFQKRLKSNKVQVLIKAFQSNVYTNSELRGLYPEVHSSIIFSLIKNRKLIELAKVLYL